MDTYMHRTMVSVASLRKIEIIRSQEFMPSEARLKFLKIIIILGPKTAILGPQFCRILVLGPHFWWSGGPKPLGPPWIRPWNFLLKFHYITSIATPVAIPLMLIQLSLAKFPRSAGRLHGQAGKLHR